MSFEHPLGRLGYCELIDHERPPPIPAADQLDHLTGGHVHLGAARGAIAPANWERPHGPANPWQGNLGMSTTDAGIAGAFVGSILVGTMAAGFVVDTLIKNKLLGFQNRMNTGDMVKRSALVGAVFGTLLAAPYAFGTYWLVRSIPE